MVGHHPTAMQHRCRHPDKTIVARYKSASEKRKINVKTPKNASGIQSGGVEKIERIDAEVISHKLLSIWVNVPK